MSSAQHVGAEGRHTANILAYTPINCYFPTPCRDISSAPFTKAVENRSVLGSKSVYHTSVALRRVRGRPVETRLVSPRQVPLAAASSPSGTQYLYWSVQFCGMLQLSYFRSVSFSIRFGGKYAGDELTINNSRGKS